MSHPMKGPTNSTASSASSKWASKMLKPFRSRSTSSQQPPQQHDQDDSDLPSPLNSPSADSPSHFNDSHSQQANESPSASALSPHPIITSFSPPSYPHPDDKPASPPSADIPLSPPSSHKDSAATTSSNPAAGPYLTPSYTDEPGSLSTSPSGTGGAGSRDRSDSVMSSTGLNTPSASMESNGQQSHVIHDSPNGSSSTKSTRSKNNKGEQQSTTSRYGGLGRIGSSIGAGGLRAASHGQPTSSQTRLVSTPSPTAGLDDPSSSSNHSYNPPPPPSSSSSSGGSATSRWLRRVASAPNTKIFGVNFSSSSPANPHPPPIPTSPSITKNGFLSPSLASPPVPPLPNGVAAGASIPTATGSVSMSSEGSSSGPHGRVRALSKGSGMGGSKGKGQKGLGIGTSSSGLATGGDGMPGKQAFRRTYSSNSIKLRSVRPTSIPTASWLGSGSSAIDRSSLTLLHARSAGRS
jgi:hypothetical protein